MIEQLSNEDKAKIFALYLGSDYQVEYVSVTTGNKTVRRGNLSIFDLYMYQPEKWEDIYTVKLLLKDLSEITLDHALEIIKIDFQRGELPEDIEHIELRRERPAIIYRWRGQNSQLTLSHNMIYPYADKLRELGYMIPYRGINLFDIGIAINQPKTQ